MTLAETAQQGTRFVRLTRALDRFNEATQDYVEAAEDVWVNATMVRLIRPYQNFKGSETSIVFSDEHSVEVKESPSDVAYMLMGAAR